jgi:hypothetical protein
VNPVGDWKNSIRHVSCRATHRPVPSLLGDDLEARRNLLRATLPIGRVVGPADGGALAIHVMTNTAFTGATTTSTAASRSSLGV